MEYTFHPVSDPIPKPLESWWWEEPCALLDSNIYKELAQFSKEGVRVMLEDGELKGI